MWEIDVCWGSESEIFEELFFDNEVRAIDFDLGLICSRDDTPSLQIV